MGASIGKRLVQMLELLIVQALALFLPFGGIRWPEAWLYLGLYVAFVAAAAVVVLRVNPGVIAERAQVKPGAKNWDLRIGRLMAIFSLGILVVAGLDRRFGWSADWLRLVRPTAQILGTALFIAGYALFDWAMASNPFFSAVVRIQKERGHVAVTGGPYRFVRHPGYMGQSLAALVTPLLLGARWGGVPAVLLVAVIVVRASLEDRTLRAELPGYQEYAQRVRYRILPGVW